MSINSESQLRHVAKVLCRDLRKKSTSAENIFWQNVRNRKFMGKKFNRQFPIFYDLNGKESFYITDFYCHELKLVIEIDGGYHERQKDYDLLRSEVINESGIEVIRFTNNEIENNLLNCLNQIKRFIKHSNPSLLREGQGVSQ